MTAGGMSDYDIMIKDKDFRIAELIYEAAQHQLVAQKLQARIHKLLDEIVVATRLTNELVNDIIANPPQMKRDTQ